VFPCAFKNYKAVQKGEELQKKRNIIREKASQRTLLLRFSRKERELGIDIYIPGSEGHEHGSKEWEKKPYSIKEKGQPGLSSNQEGRSPPVSNPKRGPRELNELKGKDSTIIVWGTEA